MVVPDGAQDTRVGRVPGLALAAGGELELLEQDSRELLRRAELELLSGELVRARLELLDPLREPRGDLPHAIRVDLDAGVLHRREHRREGQLDVLVEPLHPPLAQPGAQLGREAARGLGAPDERRGLLLRGGLGNKLEAVLAREVVEVVAGAAGVDEVRRDQRVVRRRAAEAEQLGVVGQERRVPDGAAQVLERRLHDEHLGAGRDPRAAVIPADAERLRVLTQHELLEQTPPANPDASPKRI